MGRKTFPVLRIKCIVHFSASCFKIFDSCCWILDGGFWKRQQKKIDGCIVFFSFPSQMNFILFLFETQIWFQYIFFFFCFFLFLFLTFLWCLQRRELDMLKYTVEFLFLFLWILIKESLDKTYCPYLLKGLVLIKLMLDNDVVPTVVSYNLFYDMNCYFLLLPSLSLYLILWAWTLL